MKALEIQVNTITKQYGYYPLFKSIDTTIKDLKTIGDTKKEIENFLLDTYSFDAVLCQYIKDNINRIF